jgi:hypothetical protein
MLIGPNGILHGTLDDVLREEQLTALYGVPVHLGIVEGRRTVVVETGGRPHV